MIKVTFHHSKPLKVRFRDGSAFRVSFSPTIVNPDIPSNYGLITWDGHTLTVS